jgi:hypothetical protein
VKVGVTLWHKAKAKTRSLTTQFKSRLIPPFLFPFFYPDPAYEGFIVFVEVRDYGIELI